MTGKDRMKQTLFLHKRQPETCLWQGRHVLYVVMLAFGLVTLSCGCSPGRFSSSDGETLELVISDSSATYPTTAVDPAGRTVYVVYTHGHGRSTDIYLQRLEVGDDVLQDPVRVNQIAGDASPHAQAPAQVAVAPDGTVYVAWVSQTLVEGRRFPASDIHLARSLDGGRTFEPSITVNEDAGFPTGHHFHDIEVGPDGTVYVSWLDSSERDRMAEPDRAHQTEMAGHTHNHGNDAENELPGTQLKVARSVDGGRTFEKGVVVAEGTCQCCRTAMTVTPEGTVYVAWRHIFEDQIRDIALSRSYDGGRTFSEPVRVHADDWQINGCPHAGPAVAVDEKDQVYVLWYSGSEKGKGVYYAHSQDGGNSFSPATSLALNVPISQVGVIASGNRGGVLLTWEQPLKDSVFVRHADGLNLDPMRGVQGKTPALASTDKTEALAWSGESGVCLRVTRWTRRSGEFSVNS